MYLQPGTQMQNLVIHYNSKFYIAYLEKESPQILKTHVHFCSGYMHDSTKLTTTSRFSKLQQTLPICPWASSQQACSISHSSLEAPNEQDAFMTLAFKVENQFREPYKIHSTYLKN